MKALAESLIAGLCERGNTSLRNYESGASAFYHQVELGVWLEIVHIPDNYPAWNISTTHKTLSEIRSHIEENFSDPWVFEKNNLGANQVGQSPVDLAFVLEQVRDQLYLYNDNKTVDTVTFIHNFLESKEWSLDIEDIETIRSEFDSE